MISTNTLTSEQRKIVDTVLQAFLFWFKSGPMLLSIMCCYLSSVENYQCYDCMESCWGSGVCAIAVCVCACLSTWTVKGCGSQWISCCLRLTIRTEILKKQRPLMYSPPILHCWQKHNHSRSSATLFYLIINKILHDAEFEGVYFVSQGGFISIFQYFV